MGAPLTDPSNKVFLKAIDGWNNITQRIYIW